MRRVLSAAGVIAVTFGAALAVAARGGVEHRRAIATKPGRAEGENRAAAVRQAKALLRLVALPARAVQLHTEPRGDRGLLRLPAQVPALSELIDLHRWWLVRAPVRRVYMFLRASVPKGSRLTGWGMGYPGRGAGFVDFEFGGVAGVSESGDLNIEVADLGTGSTGVRVDSQVVWTVPKSPGEEVPRAADEIAVMREKLGSLQPLTVMVTDAGKVAALVSLVDELPIVQPSVWVSCPYQPPQPIVTFTFRRRGNPTALAKAVVNGYCWGFEFIVGGRPQAPLLDPSRLVLKAQRLLGVRLTIS